MHEYHNIADRSLEIIYGAFEALVQDRDDVDVEFNVCPSPLPCAGT